MLKKLLFALLSLAWLPVQAAVSKNLEVIHEQGAAVTLNFSEAAWASRVSNVGFRECSSVESCQTVLPDIAPIAGRVSFDARDGVLYRADVRGSRPTWAVAAAWTGTNWVLWSQFVVGAQRAASAEFEALAEKHAPILAFHAREAYFPVTIDALFNRDCSDFDSGTGGCASGESIFLTSSATTDNAKAYMRWNGHRDQSLFLKPAVAKSFETSSDSIGHVVPSYWFAQKSGDTAWIMYTYFYAYDQKRNEYLPGLGSGASLGNHAVDRESLTIEFKRVGGEWLPQRVIYAGHLDTQPTSYLGCRDATVPNGATCDQPGATKESPLGRWEGGRVAVPWDVASKHGNSPIGYVAEGSHAIKPARGWYYLTVGGPDVREPAGSLEISQMRRSLVTHLPVDTNSALVFSGFTINGLGDSRMFPFVRNPIPDWIEGISQPLDDCFRGGECRTNSFQLPQITGGVIRGDFAPNLPTRITFTGKNLDSTFVTLGATNVEQICSAYSEVVRTRDVFAFDCTPRPDAVGQSLVFEFLAPRLVGDAGSLLLYRGEWAIKPLPTISLSNENPSVFDRIVVWLSDSWSAIRSVVWAILDIGGNLLASFTVDGASSDPRPFEQDIGTLPSGPVTVRATVREEDAERSVIVSRTFNVQISNANVINVIPTVVAAGTSQTFSIAGSNLPAGLTFSLEGCTGVQELAGGTSTLRQFSCAFPSSTLGGQKSGAISLVSGTTSTVLKAFSVTVNSSAASELFDNFSGLAIDPSKWTSSGYTDFGGNPPIGTVTLDTSGIAKFAAWAALSTKDKVTFSGSKIVIEARMGGVESRFILADGPDPAQSLIMVSNTSYCGWGLNIQARGPYKPIGANGGCGADIPVPAAGGYTSEMREYRLTIEGTSVLVESGPTLANITQSLTTTLGTAIDGKSFFLTIGTGAVAYSPGSFDWVRVLVDQAPVRGVENPANGHRYEALNCGSWANCRDAAQARGGQLVTIRSEEEHLWLMSTFADSRLRNFGFWIGLTDEGTEGQWKWVSGEPVIYTRWLQGQPSNSFGGENYAHLWWYGLDLSPPNSSSSLIGWNDVNSAGSGATITQAIIEYANPGVVGIDHLALPQIYDNAGQPGSTYGQTFVAAGARLAGLRTYIGDPTRPADESVNELVGVVNLVLYRIGANGALTEVSSRALGNSGTRRSGLVDFRFEAPVATSPGAKYFIGLRTSDPFGLGLRAATSSTYAGGAEAWISLGADSVTEHPTGRDVSFAVLAQ